MIGKWHLGSDPGRVRPLGDPARPGRVPRSGVLHGDRREDVHRPYATDVITDLALDFLEQASARQAVLPDDAPQGAAPAVGAGRDARRALRRRCAFPSRRRCGTRYATRTDALHENQQRVADGPDQPRPQARRRPPGSTRRRARRSGIDDEAGHGDDRARRAERDAHRRGARRAGSTSATCRTTSRRVQSVDDSVGRVLDYLDASGPRAEHASSSTPATRGSSSATTACSTSGSCTRSRSGCRSSCAGRRRSSRARGATRSALNVDFAPTFLDVAGLPASPDMQGRSLRAGAARPHAGRTGARRCTTATTTTPATTTRARTTACARARTS